MSLKYQSLDDNRKNIKLKATPTQVIINRTNDKICVATKKSVTILDSSKEQIVKEILVNNARYITADPETNLLYVALEQGIAIIDISDDTIIRNIFDEYRFGQLCINHKSNLLYGIEELNKRVVIIDCSKYELVGEFRDGKEPCAVAVNPNTNRIYLADEKSGTVSILNGPSGTTSLCWIDLPDRGVITNEVHVDPSKDNLYIFQRTIFGDTFGGGHEQGMLYAISANISGTNYHVPKEISINFQIKKYGDGHDSFAIDSEAGLIYMTDVKEKKLYVIDSNIRLLQKIRINGKCKSIALDPVKNKLYMANSGLFERSLDIIQLKSPDTE